jgi:poly-gamma-glutamate synthesis protein (capsule biosynthesis protein)
VPTGVIKNGDLVVQAFRRIGWEWGGHWVSSKDYQHVAAPDRLLPSLGPG